MGPKRYHNPVIQFVDRVRRQYPPQVFMYNEEPYPFAEADAYRPPANVLICSGRSPRHHWDPSALKDPLKTALKREPVASSSGHSMEASSSKRPLDRSKATFKPEAASEEPSSSKRQRIDHGGKNARHALAQVITIDLEDETGAVEQKNHSEEPMRQAEVVFQCDVCDSEETAAMKNHVEAKAHLEASGHSSCSQYLWQPPDGDGRPGVRQLTVPRQVRLLENVQDTGWKVGDSVIYCPKCHLMTPDKVRYVCFIYQ